MISTYPTNILVSIHILVSVNTFAFLAITIVELLNTPIRNQSLKKRIQSLYLRTRSHPSQAKASLHIAIALANF